MAKRSVSTPKTERGKSKAKAVLDKKAFQGWNTSDDDEIAIRRWRGVTEVLEVVALGPERGFFGDFRVRSASAGASEVEIRDLAKPLFRSCSPPLAVCSPRCNATSPP